MTFSTVFFLCWNLIGVIIIVEIIFAVELVRFLLWGNFLSPLAGIIIGITKNGNKKLFKTIKLSLACVLNFGFYGALYEILRKIFSWDP